MKFTLTEQLQEFMRVQPVMQEHDEKAVDGRRMRKGEAKYHKEALEAVRQTFTWLWQNELRVRRLMTTKFEEGNDATEHKQPVQPAETESSLE